MVRTDRVAVLGAGSSGLAVLKNLKAAGIACDCLERQNDLGGNWLYGSPASSVYASTHLISSKRMTEYADFPMPDRYPEYPDHRRVWEYLRSYAEHFDLRRHIEFGAGVRRATRAAGGGWALELESGQTRHYDRLVVANGHNWLPRLPEYAGEFNGVQLHSSQYKTPDVLRGRRVLVVGGGNSGCDLAVESVQNAKHTTLSLRRGYHFLPKFLHGTPIDVCGERVLRLRLPLWVRRMLATAARFLVLGNPSWVGLPKPDHRLFETHPIVNSQLVYHAGHGDLTIRPDIAELRGDTVRFSDGVEEAFDVILYATGFQVAFPFFEKPVFNWHAGRPELYLNIFSPESDDLFFAGLIQPDSGQFGLVDYQSQLIAAYLAGIANGSPAARWFRQQKRQANPASARGIRYLKTPRHALEVEHFSYRRQLKRLVRKLQK